MTTREKFEKLFKYVDEHYDLQEKDWTDVGKMKVYKVDPSFFAFRYFKLEVTIMNRAVQVELPDHIDFSQFDPKILLRDLWKEATENVGPLPKLDAAHIEPFWSIWKAAINPITTVTVQEVADKFGVHVNNLRIKE